MSLYHRPPNSFVARFFSDSNVLTARVRGGVIHADGQSFAYPSAADGDVALAIRPGSFVVGAEPEALPGLRFDGELEEHHLLGEHEQLQVRVPEIGRLVARRNIGDGAALDVGDTVRLFVPAAAVHVMNS
jgi:ABC-type Fe3+/spermidine/putrescine transport system ATPase subunit